MADLKPASAKRSPVLGSNANFLPHLQRPSDRSEYLLSVPQ